MTQSGRPVDQPGDRSELPVRGDDGHRRKRDELARGFDPYSGFTIATREPFDDKAKLRVALTLKQPKGHREEVTLGQVAAQPNAALEHEYLLSADRLPGPGGTPQPIPVDLLIRHLEPKQP